MKKILPLLCMLVYCNMANAAKSLTIVNHTSCGGPARAYLITMYAMSGTLRLEAGTCPPSVCNEIVSNSFYINPGTTLYWCDPADFDAGGGCGGSSSPVGFASVECGYTSNLGGTGCGGYFTSYSGCYPSDFVWNYAAIDLGCVGTCGCSTHQCLGGAVGSGICSTSTTLYGTGASGCAGTIHNYVTWADSGGNITIDIYDF